MSETDTSNLVRVLADFAAWLEQRRPPDIDMEYYQRLAVQFLKAHSVGDMIDVPLEYLGRCDLCGQPFVEDVPHKPEALTGNNFRWCPVCLVQQTDVCNMIGVESYRAAWRAQETGG